MKMQGINIYEVNIRQYTPEGSIKAFAREVPRLKEMGVDIVWLMPIYPISLIGRKGTLGSYYSIADYTAVNSEYGTEQDFIELVDLIHGLGMKIILDWVANHTGWDHVWTTTHPDYYLQNEHGSFYERNGWEDVIDLDYSSQDMRRAMIECMAYWIDQMHIDGFRCDMAMLVPLEFWKEAKSRLTAKKQDLIWLGECEDFAYFEVFDILYGWEWMHSTRHLIHHYQNKHNFGDLIQSFSKKIPEDKKLLLFTSNHDENSWNGTEYERYGEFAHFLAALSILLPFGVPLIYSGQELPILHRLKFFDKDLIDWNNTIELHLFYKNLLYVRNCLKPGVEEMQINTLVNHDKVFSLWLVATNTDVMLLMNLEAHPVNAALNKTFINDTYLNILNGVTYNFTNQHEIRLRGKQFVVFKRIPT